MHEQAPLRSQAVIDGKRTQHLTQPPAVAAAYAATVRSLAGVIAAFNAEITAMEEQLTACFGQTRAAEVYLSQPGLGQILAARVLGEFGDDEHRYATARNRKNYAGTSPVTRASGKKKIVLARFIHNDRLVDALHQQAFCALAASPGARAYYDELRRRGTGHRAAPRELPAAGRHPARLPEDRHRLRRAHRLGTPQPRSTNCCLTRRPVGCLTAPSCCEKKQVTATIVYSSPTGFSHAQIHRVG